MQALNAYLLIRLEDPKKETEAGLALPDLPGAGDKPGRGTIVSIGRDAFKLGDKPADDVQSYVGRKVAFRKYHSEEFEKTADGTFVVVDSADVTVLLD